MEAIKIYFVADDTDKSTFKDCWCTETPTNLLSDEEESLLNQGYAKCRKEDFIRQITKRQ